MAPARGARAFRGAAKRAPFEQYVPAPRTPRLTLRRLAASPLVRAAYAARVRTIPVVYHPRYVTGRIAAVRRNELIVDPPAGSPIIVRDPAPAPIPAGAFVALPVTYTGGSYQLYAPQQSYAAPQYGYAYAPQYGYAYAPPAYCSGNSSSALYAALLPAVIDVLSGNGANLNASNLESIAVNAAAGGGNCGYYGQPAYYSAPAYAAPPYYSTPSYYSAPSYYSTPSYSTPPYSTPPYYSQPAYPVQPSYGPSPYDTCLYSSTDGDGDEGCAPANAYTYDSYGSYSTYGAYAPQQLQGVVIGRSGDLLMVLGANGTPTFVYAAPALQSGFSSGGPIRAGEIVDAYGYYSGSTFVATALV